MGAVAFLAIVVVVVIVAVVCWKCRHKICRTSSWNVHHPEHRPYTATSSPGGSEMEMDKTSNEGTMLYTKAALGNKAIVKLV